MADAAAAEALCCLCEEAPRLARSIKHARDRISALDLLGDALIANGEPLSDHLLSTVDSVWEQKGRPPAYQPTVEGLEGAMWYHLPGDGATSSKIVVWRGDVRSLAVGAVVNAANEQGLGCFVPNHKCIDNVLHRAAGPRLREACRPLMASRGHLFAGSAPIVTPGYMLHAERVIHVTGPQIPDGRPTAAQRATLVACYTGCLEAAMRSGARSIAFCCISTGLFGYPQREAAEVALATVRDWLLASEAHRAAIETIIFDVFTDRDWHEYLTRAPSFFAPADQA